jgi:hypothetical protein
VAALPYIDEFGSISMTQASKNPLYSELQLRFSPDRFETSTFWPWERWLLTPACRLTLDGSASDEAKNLAAKFYVIVRANAARDASDRERAAIILATCARTYAHMSSFRCFGEAGSRRFVIAMDRPTGHFRFEYVEENTRYVVWRNHTGTHDWWTVAGVDRAAGKLSLALAGATGVSGGAAHTVPLLLLPTEVSGTRLTDTLATTVSGIEQVDGRDCWRIDGKCWTGSPRSVWIDCESFCLRRESEGLHYKPEVDVTIDADWFEFDPAAQAKSPLH